MHEATLRDVALRWLDVSDGLLTYLIEEVADTSLDVFIRQFFIKVDTEHTTVRYVHKLLTLCCERDINIMKYLQHLSKETRNSIVVTLTNMKSDVNTIRVKNNDGRAQ